MVLFTLYDDVVLTSLLNYLPRPVRIASFDCGTKAMGVAVLDIDPLVFKYSPTEVLALIPDLDAKLNALEKMVKDLSETIDRVIYMHAEVWDLAPGVKGNDLADHMVTVSRNLKVRLDELNPDLVVYEFQMSVNDKSRANSFLILYHFCDKCPIFRVGGALKNTVTLAKHLTHQTFIKKNASSYRANKQHCAASIDWWAQIFGIKLPIDRKVYKDAGDAFMQALAMIKHGRFFKC